MRQRKHIPEHNILLYGFVVSLDHVRDTAMLVSTLQGVFAGGVELMVSIPSNPDMMLSEQRPIVLDAVGRSEEFLRSGWDDLVSHWLSADRVLLVQILDFEDPTVERVDIQASGCGDRCLPDFVAVAIGVRFLVNLHW